MTSVDAAALTRGLKETFPNLVFIENANRWDFDNLPFTDSLVRAGAPYGGVRGFLPPPDWLARRERGEAVDWSWLRDLPWGFMYLPSTWNWRVGGGRWAFEAPTLEHGSFQAAYKKGDTDEKRFVDKLFRVLAKVTTNWMHRDVPAEGAGNHWIYRDMKPPADWPGLGADRT